MSNQLIRQWKVFTILQFSSQGVTVTELADKIEENQRSIYRDLETLVKAGFPVYSYRDNNESRWKLIDGYRTCSIFPVTISELISLQVSLNILEVFKGSIFYEGLRGLFDKLRHTLPESAFSHVDQLARTINFSFTGLKNYSGRNNVLDLVSRATTSMTRIEIKYRSLSTQSQSVRVVDPYQIKALDMCVYLVGFCHLRKDVRTFAIERIEEVRLLDEGFDTPSDFFAAADQKAAFRVMHGEPETVKIRIKSAAAHTVRERLWHPSQQVRELRNGAVIVTLRAPINREIISWILGYGSMAVVIEPMSLRSLLIKELELSAKKYNSKSSRRAKAVLAKKKK